MTTKHSVTITCDDRPGGGFACTASYTTRLTHSGEEPSVALSAARLMGWTQVPNPMGGYADRCPACSILAASAAPSHDQHSCRLAEAKPVGSGMWRCVDCDRLWHWDATLPGWTRAKGHQCRPPRFTGAYEDARTGERWACPAESCSRVWVADRDKSTWWLDTGPPRPAEHECRHVPVHPDAGVWTCPECSQRWEYATDVKAWVKGVHEE